MREDTQDTCGTLFWHFLVYVPWSGIESMALFWLETVTFGMDDVC